MMFERTRAITSALDFHRINIFDVAQAKRAAKWLKRRKTCGGVHSVFQSHWCIFSFIHHVKTTYYSSCTHEGLRHIYLPSSDMQTTPCALNFHANCLILCEKTAVSFKISIRAPRHERALLAPSPPFCFLFFLLHLEGICKCLCTLNSNDMSALWAHARWWWIQLVSHC